MSKVSDEIKSIFSSIDSLLTLIEQTPNFGDDGNYNFSLSPIQLLFELLKKFANVQKIINFLIKILTTSLPYIEMGVKGVLLAQLKATIDCVNDPRIPYYLREKGPNDGSIDNEDSCRGMLIDINAIDYKNIFSICPMEQTQSYYFGTSKFYTVDINTPRNKIYGNKKFNTFVDAYKTSCLLGGGLDNVVSHGAQTIYELARAEDMNAFLWYVINNGKTRGAIPLTTSGYTRYYFDGMSNIKMNVNILVSSATETNLESSVTKTNLGVMQFDYQAPSNYNFSPINIGETFVMGKEDEDYNLKHYSICLEKTESYVKDGEIITLNGTNLSTVASHPKLKVSGTHYSIVPYSYNDDSINWYTRSYNVLEAMPPNMADAIVGTVDNALDTNHLTKLQRLRWKQRKFNEEFGILNFQYVKGSRVTDILRGANCRYSEDQYPNGSKFLVKVLPKPLVILKEVKKDVEIKDINISIPYLMPITCLFDENGMPNSKGRFSAKDKKYIELPNEKTLEYKLTEDAFKEGLENVLYECYPKLTVYELNYDLIMGMKLFDPAVVMRDLLELTCNLSKRRVGLNLQRSVKETEYQMRISSLIEKIINKSEDSTVSDCFFTFSNEKYEELERKAELKRASLQSFDDGEEHFAEIDSEEVFNILNEYNSDGNLQENIEVLERTIESATYSITQEVLPEDRYSLKVNIVTDMLRGLITSIVETLFSPKLLMVLEINRQLGISHSFSVDLKELLEDMFAMITSIVEEIVDMLLQQMLNWLIENAKELFQKASKEIALEQIAFYTRVIRRILRNCAFKINRRKDLDTQLDDIQHAEITATDNPITKEC